MNLTEYLKKHIGARYKLVEQWVEGDSYFNVVKIRQIYAIPNYRNRRRVINEFHSFDPDEVIHAPNVKFRVFPGGWENAECTRFSILICIVPTTDDEEEANDRTGC